jgi:hypothetical protein
VSRARRERPRAAATPRDRAPRGRPPRNAALAAIALAASAVGLLVAVRGDHREARVALAGPPPADSAAGLSIERAYGEAAGRHAAGRAIQSLPYWVRVRSLLARDVWSFHLAHANALHDAALEDGARSAFERVGFMREALVAVARAEALAPSPQVRAALIQRRAYLLRVWGFDADAWQGLGEALRLAPGEPDLVASRAGLGARLEHPEDPHR